MKKYILLAASVCLATSGFAQAEKDEKEEKKEKVTVPATVSASFAKAFKGATKVEWGKEDADYEANFVQNGQEMAAVYTAKGELKETEVDIKAAALPAAAADYVKKNYPGAAIKEAAKITLASGVVNYEAEVNKTDLMFDVAGKFLRAEKD